MSMIAIIIWGVVVTVISVASVILYRDARRTFCQARDCLERVAALRDLTAARHKSSENK